MVEQHFNQLTVFDPRVPHGVAVVEGVREPTESRIVLHGWFTSSGPFFKGALHGLLKHGQQRGSDLLVGGGGEIVAGLQVPG